MKLRRAIGVSAALTPAEPPTEWLLLPLGELRARWVGGQEATFRVDDAAITAILAGYLTGGHDLSLDYNHAQFDDRPRNDRDMRSAGSFDLERRRDGLWMVNIQWTSDAADYLRRREYRYLSPTFSVDEDGRIVALHNVALTPNPATLGALPLVASSYPPGGAGEEITLDPALLTLVGLAADTPTPQVHVRLATLANFERSVLETLSVTTRDDAMAAIEAGQEATRLTTELTARVDELETAAAAAEREQVLSDARRDGRLSVAQCADGGWARTVNLDVLKAFLASAPRIVPSRSALQEPRAAEADKTWEEMSGVERGRLYLEDKDRYLELRKSATGR